MKTAILLTDGVKQIMFTPENKNEKQALKMISPDDKIRVVVKTGTFGSASLDKVLGVQVYLCQGGYYRAVEQEDSVMFVITPKKKK